MGYYGTLVMRLTIQAIRLFLEHARLRSRVPNKATTEAMKEANDFAGLKRYRLFRELRDRI